MRTGDSDVTQVSGEKPFNDGVCWLFTSNGSVDILTDLPLGEQAVVVQKDLKGIDR